MTSPLTMEVSAKLFAWHDFSSIFNWLDGDAALSSYKDIVVVTSPPPIAGHSLLLGITFSLVVVTSTVRYRGNFTGVRIYTENSPCLIRMCLK